MNDSFLRPGRPERGEKVAERIIGEKAPSHARWLRLGIAALFLTVLFAGGCAPAAKSKGGEKTVEVIATKPIGDDVTDYQDFTGRLDALKTVDVRPRVSGYILEAPFKEGDVVKEGQLLFQIDPRTYQADLDVAEANLKQAEADRKLQVHKAERARQLIGNGSVSQEEYDQAVANRDRAIATVGSMKAARDRAELYLKFTRVVAPALHDDEGRPLSGRISRRQVDPGNLVNADQTILTTIVSEDRMYAYFDVDERTYLDLVAATSSASTSPGGSKWFSSLQFPVLMRLANQDEFTEMGHVNFLDNRLNANTGTVRMRGVFNNPSRVLKSGLFVRIRLPLGTPYKTILIPDEALMSDQGRKYVYVVNDKEEVEYRSVTLGQTIEGLRAIKSGLKEGERVIVSGMQRVRPKLHVQVKMQDPPAPPKSSLTRMLAAYHPENEHLKTDVRAPNLSELPPAHSGGKSKHSEGQDR